MTYESKNIFAFLLVKDHVFVMSNFAHEWR